MFSCCIFIYDQFRVNFCVWHKIVQIIFFFFAWICPVVPASFVDKTIDFPLNCLGALVESQLTIPRVYFWILNSVCWSVCPPIFQYHTALWLVLFGNWKMWILQVFFPQDCFDWTIFLTISFGFWISWSVYWKCSWYFIEDCVVYKAIWGVLPS